MSALTDLFTAMANKIRSKTGTATTYTPLQMVSDGIDDVYAAGYDAGGGGAAGIPITPSNASPVSLTTGDSYQMLANGYAIASYSSATPSNANPFFMQEDEYYKLSQGWAGGYLIGTYDQITPSNASPVSLSSGNIYKMGGAGKAVASVTDATPSNSSPVSLSSGTVYKMGGAGKAVASVTDITPSSSAQTLSSGSIYKMGGVGYVYNPKPTGGFSETTLWTNSSPTSNFAAQTVTLNQTMTADKFDYIKVVIRFSTTDSTQNTFLFPIADVLSYNSGSTDGKRGCVGSRSGGVYVRTISNGGSTSALAFTVAAQTGGTSTSAAKTIPVSISGLKFTP